MYLNVRTYKMEFGYDMHPRRFRMLDLAGLGILDIEL